MTVNILSEGLNLQKKQTSPLRQNKSIRHPARLLGFWILTVESGSGWGLWTTCVHTCSVRIWGGRQWEDISHTLCSHQWCSYVGIFERKTFCYLIQSVVGRHSHSVGVLHEPFSQESKQAVCVHDLNLPPVDKHTQTHNGKVPCLELPEPLRGSVRAVISLPRSHPQGAGLQRQASGTACCHKLGKFCWRCVR